MVVCLTHHRTQDSWSPGGKTATLTASYPHKITRTRHKPPEMEGYTHPGTIRSHFPYLLQDIRKCTCLQVCQKQTRPAQQQNNINSEQQFKQMSLLFGLIYKTINLLYEHDFYQSQCIRPQLICGHTFGIFNVINRMIVCF